MVDQFLQSYFQILSHDTWTNFFDFSDADKFSFSLWNRFPSF